MNTHEWVILIQIGLLSSVCVSIYWEQIKAKGESLWKTLS